MDRALGHRSPDRTRIDGAPAVPQSRHRNYSRFATRAPGDPTHGRFVPPKAAPCTGASSAITIRNDCCRSVPRPAFAKRKGSIRNTQLGRCALRADNRPQFVGGSRVDAGQFLSALMAIVVIDIVLAGDNAIVIALAARQLPPHLQKKAIVWGALGAVGVRVVLTAAVVWLLKIPGLLAVGGALLVWIAWKLLQPDEGGGESAASHAPVVTSFWGAMRTVIIADAL